MSFRRLGNRVRNLAERRHDRQRAQKRSQSRQNLVQQLEDRRLLAGPELIAIRPDAGALLFDGDTLNVAPREFNLQFRAGADLDESSISNETVKLVGSGGDGTFGDGNEVDIALGYVGLEVPGDNDPTNLQRIVFRTSSSAAHNATEPTHAFPDDTYQIQISGSGPLAVLNRSGEAFNDGQDLTTSFTLDRGMQVVAVVPQPIRHNPFSQEFDTIEVYFDDQAINPAQVVDPAFYRLVNTSNSLTAADDSTLLPESVTYDADADKVTLKFESAIPEGTYRLDVGQSGGDNSIISSAIQIGTLSDGNRFEENGFLGDAGGRSDNAADIDLYSADLAAGTTLDVVVHPHDFSLSTTLRVLDNTAAEIASVTAAAGFDNVLSLPIAVAGEYFLEVTSADGSTGSYLLDASVTGSPITTSDDNSTFSTATGVGNLGAARVRISSDIRPQNVLIPARPGSDDEPGHRMIQREAHTGLVGTTPVAPAPIAVINYYFPDTLGEDNSGAPYLNLITETEKQIVREIFEVYASLSGYEFVESPATDPFGDDLMIGKGDLRATDPTLAPNSGVAGIATGASALLNGSLFDQSNRFYGDGFTSVMFHEIGHSLGLGHAYDIPANMGAGVLNDVLPGNHDIVHLQRVAPPNSTDIDMYEFTLSERGRLQVETVAERLGTPSLLDTALKLYRQVGDDFELVAQNDQYFGADSFLELTLEPGNYFVGVSSTGNTSYDPRVPDSGFDGTTDGAYDLVLNFEAEVDGTLTDATFTPIDGDGDGVPGGVYSFWFQSTDADTAIYVNKMTDTTIGPEGSGSISDPYDTLEFALEQAGNRIVVPNDAVDSIASGQRFVIDDGINIVTFEFGSSGSNGIDIGAAGNAAQVALEIESAVENAVLSGDLAATVSVDVSGRVVQFSGIDNLNLAGSPTLLNTPNLVHVLADGGLDQDVDTLADNRPYLVGLDVSGNPLPDGAEFLVPQGVNVMIQAGALFKMRRSNLDAGSSSANISRSNSSIQVLGVPERSVFLRSYHNDSVGGDSDGVGPAPSSGDFGGIVFRDDSDMEDAGVFLNYVNHADINNGGGNVFVDSNELPFAPIYMVDSRPTLSFNRITSTNGAAISASPDSFDDSNQRIGPDVVGNYLEDNKIDGLFIRVRTPLGSTVDKLDGFGRLNDTDITHVLSETLIVAGGAGGPVLETVGGRRIARPAGRLMVDPGLVFKLDTASIEVERGAGTLIAEGDANLPIIFTSIADDRYGGSGSFNTDPIGDPSPLPGDWGGIFFGQATSGSIDHALIAYGGGTSTIEGGEANFNALEIHQAEVRLANSQLQSNADGIRDPGLGSDGVRNGRGRNASSVIYVRGSQPIIVDNTIIGNDGSAIFINADSLRSDILRDIGRMTGPADRYSEFDDNRGPLVRLNELDDNAVNGMAVRGEFLTIESVWDDTDIVHALFGEVVVGNHHTYSGLTLQSSNSESLVVKVANANGGFTATGKPLEIEDRIGGTIHVLGTVGHPVVMTSIDDDSVGAGFTPSGELSSNTNNSASPSSGSPGDWRGLLFDEFSNDRNVAIIRELENPLINGVDVNFTPGLAQSIGVLAPNEKGGDENRRLGFQVQGFISPTNPDDVDVYSFIGTAGTEVWLDIDRTDSNLDAMIEVVNATGTVLARSLVSAQPNSVNPDENALTKEPPKGGDHFSLNFRDPGMRYVLPGNPGDTGTFFVRVRSNPANAPSIESLDGESRGEYRLQVRLRQIQEEPGSTVRFSDIRYAATGIDVRGLPAHSPIVGEAGEVSEANGTFGAAQDLINLLQSDIAAISISGQLQLSDNNGDGVDDGTDVDWYSFELTQTDIQLIGGFNDGGGTIGVVFDVDYADGAVRADSTIAVYDEDGNLVYLGRESNVEADQPAEGDPNDFSDLARGSLGKKDPYIGPIHLTPGTEASPKRYFVAVMSDRQIPSAINGIFQTNTNNALTRLEPVNSVVRIVEDHLGFQGYTSQGLPISPTEEDGLFDVATEAGVDLSVEPFTLEDVVLYVATDQVEDDNNFGDDEELFTVDPSQSSRWLTRIAEGMVPGTNDIQDVTMRTDGRLFGYQRLNDDTANVGALVQISTETGATTLIGTDNIPGTSVTPNTSVYSNLLLNQFGREVAAEQFTTSDDVDALAFTRLGTVGPPTAPIPEYDVFYVVRESNTSSKLYRASQDGDATWRRITVQTENGPEVSNYGFVGKIQPAGVTYEVREIEVRQPVDNAPDPVTEIRLKSKTAGVDGAFDIQFTGRPNNTNVDVNVNLGARTIFLTIGGTGNPITGAPTAQAIVDAINGDPEASQLVTAYIHGGNANTRPDGGDGAPGTQAVVFTETLIVAGDAQTEAALNGRVTGISFGEWDGSGNLFGVTDEGEFIEFDPVSAQVVNYVDARNSIGVPTLSFEGLTLGPQNVEDGRYRNTLFAITDTGQLVAFDTDGNGELIFASNTPTQVLSAEAGPAGGFFTLTTDASAPGGPVAGRNTTDPIGVDAPAFLSVNETQLIRSIGPGAGGTFTLSFVDDQGEVTSPRFGISAFDTTLFVQDPTGFPAAPFVIQVENEQMLVNGVFGDAFTVTRGFNGTAQAAHADTTSVIEVRTSVLSSTLGTPVSSAVATPIDSSSNTLFVNDASAFPAATPFTIRVENEEMIVTAVNGNELTVDRGQNSTGAAAHRAGRTVHAIDDQLAVLDPSVFPAAAPFNLRVNGEDLRVVNVVGNTFDVIRGANGSAMSAHGPGSTVSNLQTTSALPFDASNSMVQAALSALPGIGFGNVLVSDGPLDGNPISRAAKIEFVGDLATKDLQPLTGDATNLVGDEIQQISIAGDVVGGTFQLQFNGETTGDLPFDITAADLQLALTSLPSIGVDDIRVTGSDLATAPLFVTFTGDLQDQNVGSLLVPFATEALLRTEIQQINVNGNPTGGNFTLSLNDPANGLVGTSGDIANNAAPDAVRTALEAIPGLAGNIVVTGAAFPGGTVRVRFVNALGGLDIQQFTVSNNLSGGLTPSVSVIEFQSSDAAPPFIFASRQGTPVSVPVITQDDGRLSVRDALQALPNFAVGDIVAAGIMQPPGTGVNITFGGNYANVFVPLLEVDNSLNSPGTPASIDIGGDGTAIMDITGMVRGGAAPIGLAFSPLDFNLWHPTTRRGNDAGHGINDTDDLSRDPGDEDVEYIAPDFTREFNEGQGAISYHFGLEPWVAEPRANSLNYISYNGVNAQYGILTEEFHADLSSNRDIITGTAPANFQGSYNLPGGALGTLTTNAFDLTTTVSDDRPTLYFNYFLDTEGHQGSNFDTDEADPFRDSARVFISRDDGLTWELAATNSSLLSGNDPDDDDLIAELPGFLSHLSDAGLNSEGLRDEGYQMVQELYDSSGQWRQARVDLSRYAGLSGLRLRVDFSTAGSMNDPTLGRVLDSSFGLFEPIDGEFVAGNGEDEAPYGEYASVDDATPRSVRSVQNQFEGFYIDDFIIGYAERGEMVTGANGDSGITNLFGNDRTRDDDPDQFADITSGQYQLEIRRTGEHLGLIDPETFVVNTYDTNSSHVTTTEETARISFEPSTFIPDLTPSDTDLLGGFPASQIDPWTVSPVGASVGSFGLASGLSGGNPVSIFEATAAELGSTSVEEGVIRFTFSTFDPFFPFSVLDNGFRFFIDGKPQVMAGKVPAFYQDDFTIVPGPTFQQTVEFNFPGGNPTFSWVFDNTLPGSVQQVFLDDIRLVQGGTTLLGDRNRERAQGTLILDSNFVTDSEIVGINVQPGTAQGDGGGVPHQGSTIFYPQFQRANDALIPGVVIQNNVISGSSGIRFAGENANTAQRPVPFGRIVNNTLVGDDNSGIGIEVSGLASPTLLNNLINDYGRAIDAGNLSPIIRSNFFQDNTTTDNTGTTAIVAGPAADLFLDKDNGNFYLVDSTRAIDSSQNTEQDRADYLTFKTELGIPASPINAPDRDVFGQLRVDPGASELGDRGAVERTDNDAPYATLLTPVDNDAEGNDRDPSDTVVWLTDPLLENFTIFLGDGRGPNSPFQGTGVNGLTVDDPNDDAISASAIQISQNGTPLEQGVDYVIGYNELSGILRLTPLSTLWEPSSVYVIELNNQLIADRAGNLLRSNQRNGDTRFTIIIPDVEIDFGDAPDTYQTFLASDGPRHVISANGLPVLGTVVDGDEDGNPSVGADGDDFTGTGGDDDGLLVGAFQGAATTEGLILADGTVSPTSDPADVIAFLDRNDRAGAVLPIEVTGTGKLDVWIDLNIDGDFLDQGEKVISGLDVSDGINQVRVITPESATTGLTYARFRISEAGSFDPFGLAIGGEVEDYRVNIVDIVEPMPLDDSYTVNEDEVLTVDGSSGSQPSLIQNESDAGQLPTEEYVHSLVVIDAPLVSGTTDTYQTDNGTVRLDDPVLGLFTYTPNSDFYGPDSFRYRISKQRNDGPEADAEAIFATVNIEVAPINDQPFAGDVDLVSLEYQPGDNFHTFFASELLASAIGDEDIQLPSAPWDESNQDSQLRVISISAGGDTIDVNNQSGTLVTPQFGMITAVFETELADPTDPTTFDRTFISEIRYTGADYFNSDNLRDLADPRILDQFSFTIQDDGRSIGVDGLNPDGTPILGAPVAGTPLTADAVANILVAPRNSDPVPSTDLVSIDNPLYNDYFLNQTPPETVPVPTEDTQLLIPAEFLLANDLPGTPFSAGPFAANDEIQGVNGNDGALQIVSATMDALFGTVVADPTTGDILFTPAPDVYGQVVFSYTVEDMGVDEELNGDRAIVPRTAEITSTIFIEPVNDAPVAHDRAFTITENVEPVDPNDPTTPAILDFTADQLMDGVNPIADSPITTTAGSITVVAGDALVDGQTLVITDTTGAPRVVEFSTSTTPSIGTELLLIYTEAETADEVATNLAALLSDPLFAATATGDTVSLTANSIVVQELANVPGDFAFDLGTPYDESEQVLRIVSFTTSEGNITVADDFTGTETLATSEGGTLTLNFVDGAFTDGSYAPAVDYNRLQPFQPFDQFTYGILDDGMTTLPVAGTVRDLDDAASVTEATVTITVEPSNDFPFIENLDSIDVPEDPTPAEATINDVFTTVLPGRPTAQDELQDQGRPTVDRMTGIQVDDPRGVMADLPIVTPTGGLTVFPNEDMVGQVVYVFTFVDDHPTDPRSTDVTVTVNVRPVNDAPRFDPDVTGTMDMNGDDDKYSVAEVIDPNTNEIIDGTITYTLKEDNTQAGGFVDTPYFIPLRRDPGVSGYNRVGLLDVFLVGPPNEADPAIEGGDQTLVLDQFPPRTDLGGTLTLGADLLGNPGLFYTPPVNYNTDIGPADSFTYTVADDGTTFVGGSFDPDPRTTNNRVEFVLNPVNDRPQFDVNLLPEDLGDPNSPLRHIETVEDSDQITIENFAFSIEPGPPATAFDEVDVINGQRSLFDVTPLSFSDTVETDFFSVPPQITPTGTLSFQPAPDVFGSFEFEVVLIDNGDDDLDRGDLNTSIPVTVTIDVLPINDPPVVRTDVDPLEFSIDEDSTLDIFSVGVGNDRGLLDVFAVGPANEAADIAPAPGGNQTVSLREPTPVQTAFGGSVSEIRDQDNNLIGLTYTPRPNFVGTDSFIYTVTDDGTTVDFGTGGAERFDPRIASNTVTIVVNAVNNTPQYSGPSNVVVDEDAGPVVWDNFATNVLPGPRTALDELDTQDVFFTITQLTGDPSLFASAPVAVINDDETADLQFEPAGDANGVATFEVILTDIPTDGTLPESTAPRTFTLRVNPINDPPTFEREQDPVTVLEDAGPVTVEGWAFNISPGPSDEASQTVRFEVVTPDDALALFQQAPEISDDGTLRFIPAANANGSVDVTVTAIDDLNGESTPPDILRIIIEPVNDRPLAVADSVATDEDTELVILASDLLANDIDPDINNPDDTLSVVMDAEGFSLSGASVMYNESTGEITYDPSTSIVLQSLAPGETAFDSFTYRVMDAGDPALLSNIVTVAVTVDGINDAPNAVPDNPTLNPNGPTIIPVLDNDSDVDGDIVPGSIEITLQPAFGSLSIDNDGVITFTAFQSFALEDVFRYRVADETGEYSAQALVTIEANAAPVARGDQAITFLGEPIVVDVTANDFDPDPEPGAPDGGLVLSSIQIVDLPRNGDAVPLSDGTIRYIPDSSFLGIDSFTYTIEDSAGRVSSPGTVQVQVAGSRLQNPDLNADVNDDGNISPIDALLVINHLARSGAPSIPVLDTDTVPPNLYYDVNGNKEITPLDALEVINELARREASTAQGEQVQDEGAVLNEVAESVAAPIAVDFIDQIAIAVDDDDDEERLHARDAAFGDLL